MARRKKSLSGIDLHPDRVEWPKAESFTINSMVSDLRKYVYDNLGYGINVRLEPARSGHSEQIVLSMETGVWLDIGYGMAPQAIINGMAEVYIDPRGDLAAQLEEAGRRFVLTEKKAHEARRQEAMTRTN